MKAKIREARFEDYNGIKLLHQKYDLEIAESDLWESFWKKNPDYHEGWPIGWVIEDETQKIQGCYQNIPRGYFFKDQPILAAAGNGLVVDAEFRTYSFLLISQMFRQKNAELLLHTTARDKSAKAIAPFKVERLPLAYYDQAFFWITNFSGFAESLFKQKGFGQFSFVLPFLGPVFKLFQTLSKPRSVGEAKWVEEIDEKFDEFWKKLKESKKEKLIARRDAQTLRFLFNDRLKSKKIWINRILSEKGEIKAYAVFGRTDNAEYGLLRVRCLDVQVLDCKTDHAFLKLFCLAMQRCQDEKIHMLEVLGFEPEKRSLIESMHPFKRKLESWPYFYKAKDPEIHESLKNAGLWDPCGFDGDSVF